MKNILSDISLTSRQKRLIAVIVATIVVFFVMYRNGLGKMLDKWDSPEFSHGFFIPLITIYLIWQRRSELGALDLKGSWLGVVVLFFASLFFVLGEMSAVYLIVHYAFILTLYGLIISLMGMRAFRVMLVPLLFLFLMVPIPDFLYQGLSHKLQLISSQIGVAVIRLFGISVYLEGNIIDLGTYKLQVVEACSGLKYLFSLTSIGFLCAYIYNDKLWKRIVIFLSSIPITIFMNSFRIGVTGILVEYGGISHADGFLHEFEGLIIFAFAVAILMGVMALLARIGKPRKKLRDVFAVPESTVESTGGFTRLSESKPFLSAIGVMLLFAVSMELIGARDKYVPQRKSFNLFTDQLGDWKAKRQILDQATLESLKTDDYLMSNYMNPQGQLVNFYVAWYNSQKAGKGIHSPQACIPGGGWQISELKTIELKFKDPKLKNFRVNRLIIKRGELKQLVYYWFHQRKRIVTNEYSMKWYIFWDSLMENRSDGALIRVTTVVNSTESIETGDKRLLEFLELALEPLKEYVPN